MIEANIKEVKFRKMKQKIIDESYNLNYFSFQTFF